MNDPRTVSLPKATRFFSVGDATLATFAEFLAHVLKHGERPSVIGSRNPGHTGWSHQIPFWTENARPCARLFPQYPDPIADTRSVDDATGLKLMHGYFCAGMPGNNTYSTFRRSDFADREWKPGVSRESVAQATIGVKFYLYREKQEGGSPRAWDPRLVVIGAAMRVEEGEIVSLPLTINTNLYFVGGHAGETIADTTFRHYSKSTGWTEKKDGSGWGSFRSSQSEQDIARERASHDRILERLIASLAA